MMQRERSAHIFTGLASQKDDMNVRTFVKGLALSIQEDHLALEGQSDMRAIGQYQGRIALARQIIQNITAPKRARTGGE